MVRAVARVGALPADLQIVELVDNAEMHVARAPLLLVDGIKRRMQDELQPECRLLPRSSVLELVLASASTHGRQQLESTVRWL